MWKRGELGAAAAARGQGRRSVYFSKIECRAPKARVALGAALLPVGLQPAAKIRSALPQGGHGMLSAKIVNDFVSEPHRRRFLTTMELRVATLAVLLWAGGPKNLLRPPRMSYLCIRKRERKHLACFIQKKFYDTISFHSPSLASTLAALRAGSPSLSAPCGVALHCCRPI